MARCKSESQDAYNRGDHAAAKDLSKQGKNHKQKMEQLNKDASDWIYHENNRDCRPGEIDLHRLRVKEAIARTDTALEEAKRRGDSEIRLIVGKGLHSEGGAAKVRPAIKGLMRKYKLVAEFDPSNSGVLVVELNGCPPVRHRHHLGISHRRSSGRSRRTGNIGA
jgi:DNA-nicking Smr family endonuclease